MNECKVLIEITTKIYLQFPVNPQNVETRECIETPECTTRKTGFLS